MKWNLFRATLVAAAAIMAFVGGVYAVYFSGSALQRAQRLGDFEIWNKCRAELSRYLVFHPGDSQAHLLFAESAIKDLMLDRDQALKLALEHLAYIPDVSSQGAAARTKEAQILFVQFRSPTLAESKFRRALQLDSDHFEAWFGLWKLLTQTERWHLAEDAVWNCYRLSRPDSRLFVLREWYMTQFFPTTANFSLDQAMGIVGDQDPNADISDGLRYHAFVRSEPQSALGKVCYARWLYRNRQIDEAIDSLNTNAKEVNFPSNDPFYLWTLIELLSLRGELDEAKVAFEKWPNDYRQSFEYWSSYATILDDVEQNYEDAIPAYYQALSYWPGPIDWSLRSKLAACLARAGQTEKAEQERVRVNELEMLLTDDNFRRQREILARMDDSLFGMEEIVEFYKSIERPKEAASWEEALQFAKEASKDPKRSSPDSNRGSAKS
ncbi:MAG: tetratricopeptide repeat protein [Planctomycetes bacterium]|nr:tetratricopeptide repeat protein [Planctomycetota bacterium]